MNLHGPERKLFRETGVEFDFYRLIKPFIPVETTT